MRTPALLLAVAVLVTGCATGTAQVPSPSRTYPPTERTTAPATTLAVRTPTPAVSPEAAKTTVKPVIVLDPGHSPSVHAIDPKTGLDVSDYANEPEMHDVFAVALLVRTQLTHDGYRVVLTKKTADSRVSLGQRAAIANHAHAALAVSIHDQAGAAGGIGYRAGNNIVYYQSVGTYRSTPAGKRVRFTNTKVAATSKRYGRLFQSARTAVEHTPVRLQGNIGYNMSSRGLPAGDIWMVQLLSTVPWIYNEAGGNSAGRVGLSRADEKNYATALVRAIEKCVPIEQ